MPEQNPISSWRRRQEENPIAKWRSRKEAEDQPEPTPFQAPKTEAEASLIPPALTGRLTPEMEQRKERGRREGLYYQLGRAQRIAKEMRRMGVVPPAAFERPMYEEELVQLIPEMDKIERQFMARQEARSTEFQILDVARTVGAPIVGAAEALGLDTTEERITQGSPYAQEAFSRTLEETPVAGKIGKAAASAIPMILFMRGMGSVPGVARLPGLVRTPLGFGAYSALSTEGGVEERGEAAAAGAAFGFLLDRFTPAAGDAVKAALGRMGVKPAMAQEFGKQVGLVAGFTGAGTLMKGAQTGKVTEEDLLQEGSIALMFAALGLPDTARSLRRAYARGKMMEGAQALRSAREYVRNEKIEAGRKEAEQAETGRQVEVRRDALGTPSAIEAAIQAEKGLPRRQGKQELEREAARVRDQEALAGEAPIGARPQDPVVEARMFGARTSAEMEPIPGQTLPTGEAVGPRGRSEPSAGAPTRPEPVAEPAPLERPIEAPPAREPSRTGAVTAEVRDVFEGRRAPETPEAAAEVQRVRQQAESAGLSEQEGRTLWTYATRYGVGQRARHGNPEAVEFVGKVNEAIGKLPEAGESTTTRIEGAGIVERYPVGKEFEVETLFATSRNTSPTENQPAYLEVRGRSGRDVSGFQPSTFTAEAEVLYPKGTKFRVVEQVKDLAGKTRIVVEEVAATTPTRSQGASVDRVAGLGRAIRDFAIKGARHTDVAIPDVAALAEGMTKAQIIEGAKAGGLTVSGSKPEMLRTISRFLDRLAVSHDQVDWDKQRTPQPRQQGEAGFIRLPGAEDVSQRVQQISRGIVRVGGSLIARVRQRGEAGERGARMLEDAISEGAKAEGEIRPVLDAALRATTRAWRAAAMSTKVAQGRTGYNTLKAMVEGKAPVTKGMEPVVTAIRSVTDALGRMYQSRGLTRAGPDGREDFPYIPGGKIMPYAFKSEFYRLLQIGPGAKDGWRTLVDSFAKSSHKADPSKTLEAWKELAEKDLLAKHEQFNELVQGDIGFIPAEFRRMYPDLPKEIHVGGRLVEILETNPHAYLEKLARMASARLGWIKVAGQDTAKFREIHAELVKTEGAQAARDWSQAVRAVHGHGIEPQPRWMQVVHGAPGGVRDVFWRGVDNGLMTARSLLLSARIIRNIPEPARWGAWGRTTRAFVNLARDMDSSGKAGLLAHLERIGVRNPDIQNWTMDVRRPVTEALRLMRQTSDTFLGGRKIEEFQEALASSLGEVDVHLWQQGKYSNRDIHRLRTLGKSTAEAMEMVQGKAAPEVYERYMRELPAKLTGGTARLAQMSVWENHPFWRKALTFQKYAGTVIRHMGSSVSNAASGVREGISTGNWRLVDGSVRQLASEMFGAASAGAIATALYTWIFDGESGLEREKRDLEEHGLTGLASFAWESMMQTLVAGPYDASIKMATGDGELGDLVLPLSIFQEVADAVMMEGRYQSSYNIWDSMATMLKRFTPPARIAESLIAEAAGGDAVAVREMDESRRRFWGVMMGEEWIDRKEFDTTDFRRSMSRAYRAIRDRDIEGTRQHLQEAFGLSKGGRQSLRSSLRNKKLLDRFRESERRSAEENALWRERWMELNRRLTPEDIQNLKAHDVVLDHLIDQLK